VVGRTEREVALDLEVWVRTHGSEAVPFPYIVATGPRGAMPHAETSDTVLRPGDLLVVDIGAQVDGYASDVTRTYAVGSVGAEEQALHALVLEAQEAARHAAHAGMTCAKLDEVARGVIEAAGKGELFKHGLGHGVGLDVHEEPRVSSRSTDVLTAGMVVTIEPGVYVPNMGGVRIEDTVLITETGIEVLSECDRGLTELG
jgi:Xaa-Pro aminopeptidase